MALAAYRNILRSAKLAFQGDLPTLFAAKKAARLAFDIPQTQSSDTEDAIAHANSVAQILRENVVQGKAVDGTNNKFKLRIHEHTERGDNDSIRLPKSGQASTCKSCS